MNEQLRRRRIAAGQRQRWAQHDNSVAELDELLAYVKDGGRDPKHITDISTLHPADSTRVVVRGLLNQAEQLLKQVKQAERLVERAEREVRGYQSTVPR